MEDEKERSGGRRDESRGIWVESGMARREVRKREDGKYEERKAKKNEEEEKRMRGEQQHRKTEEK